MVTIKILGLLVITISSVYSKMCPIVFKKEFAECRFSCDGFGVENYSYGDLGCLDPKLTCCIPDEANKPTTSDTTQATSVMTTEIPTVMPALPSSEQCGMKAPPTPRIVSGTMTKPCDWPWQVSIRSRLTADGELGPDNTFPWCSGVLISESWVLTTAYCVVLSISTSDKDGVLVTVGEFNNKKADYTGSTTNEQWAKISDIKMHPKYYQTDINAITTDDIINSVDDKMSNNMALIKLESPVTLNKCAQKVCTPTQEDCWSKKECKIAGWGNTALDKVGETSDELLEADITIYSPAVCETIFGLDMGFNNMSLEIKPLTTCARPTNPDVSVCLGDNGGMVVCKNSKGLWTVEGLINSPSHEKCKPDGLFLISYVQPALEWIKSTTGM